MATEALSIDPLFGQALIARAFALMGLREYGQAIADFRKATDLSPNDALAWLGMSEAARLSGKLTDAIEYVSKAIAKQPDFAEAYLARGLARAALGEREAALADFDHALKLNPGLKDAVDSPELWRLHDQLRFPAPVTA